MKTAELKKTADHIERAESEEEFINRLRSALKEHAIEFKNWCEGNYAIKLGQFVPTTDDWTTDDWYDEFNQ